MSQNIMNMIAEHYRNSAQMISGKHQKFWKIVRKRYVVEFPLNRVVRIQSRANYPIALWIHFGSAQKGKDVRKIQNFKTNLSKTVPFSLTLQPWIPEFLSSANTD